MTLQLAALTATQKQRRVRNARPKPEQAELFEPMVPLAPAAKPAEPVPPKATAQSRRAAEIAAETTMQNEARRTLAAKAEKSAKPKSAKPRVKVLTS